MTILNNLALNKIAEFIDEKLDSAVYVQTGSEFTTPFDVIVIDNNVTVRVYLDENVDGTIEGVRVYDDDSDLFIEQMHEFIKPSNRGFYKIFRISVRELIR